MSNASTIVHNVERITVGRRLFGEFVSTDIALTDADGSVFEFKAFSKQSPAIDGMDDAAQTAAYAEGRKDEREEWEARILPLLKELHDDGTLSEGQCAKYWGGAILDWRMASQPAPHPFAQEGGDE